MQLVRMRPLISLLLVIALAGNLNGQGVPLTAAGQRVHERVAKLAIGDKMTVQMSDRRELHGNLSSIDSDGFSLREVDLKTTLIIRYNDVAHVERGYGAKGFMGRRVSPRRSLIAGIIIITVLLTIVFVAVANDKS